MQKEEIERLFQQHYSQMIRLARRMLYDGEESNDVVSEVFAALMKLDEAPTHVETYLLTSVRNRCVNLLEHKKVRQRFEQAYMVELSEGQPADKIPFDAGEEEQQLTQLLTFAEQNLSAQTLRVFRMRHLDGLKYQEIADQLGISRVMVYKHLTKAMNTIREYNQQKK